MTAKLKFGLRVPSVHPMDVEAMRAWVLKAEALGFDSIWAGDHVFYRVDVPQPLHLLTWVAAQTSRVRLGTAIMLTSYLNPVHLAKSAATLDALSGGRLTLGVSIGGTEAEYHSIGVPMEQRLGRLLENVAIMKKLWAGDDVSYEGRYYQVKDASIKPKPAQPGGVPVYFGSQREPMLRRIGRTADGWVSSAGTSTDAFLDGVKDIRRFAKEKGREPDSLGFAKLHFASIGRDKAEAAGLAHKHFDAYYGRTYNVETGVAHGTVSEVREELSRFLETEAPAMTVVIEPPGLGLEQLDLLSEATKGL
ncbi:MAG: LLM class flavin-dependent oxidoreductase [Dehalococcoidia bacterium]|nr:LLM class flavin-dependent oxidoreductase [Dehalococcoidia bacterium]